jgi:hypothetical protein
MTARDSDGNRRQRISLSTLLLIVAVIAAECAVVVEIKRCYVANGGYLSDSYPEWLASPAVLAWLILGSLTVFAIRKCSLTRLAIQLTISCALVASRLSLRGKALDGAFDVMWPAACFGLFIAVPYLLVRSSRAGHPVLVLADAAAVALLTYLFAVHPCVPGM